MKSQSRSHRLPTTDPPDDWGDGSWTVDCSCGVNFDDGEEMVSCDECGIWVHTRCSRFVRGDPSFACHNCKKAEETEVAQLLAEQLPLAHLPHRPPFRVVPMEDRVHVQGLPGGDSSLFTNTIFSSNLWKRSGYVPKKFNFRYKEFSCWDEDCDGENGANVLFSLSKTGVTAGGELQGWGKKERNDRLRAMVGRKGKKKKKGRGEEGNEEVSSLGGGGGRGGEKHVVVVKSRKEGRKRKVDNGDGNTGSNESTKDEVLSMH